MRGRAAGTGYELWKLCIIGGCFTAIRWPSWTESIAELWIAQEREQRGMQSCAYVLYGDIAGKSALVSV